MACKPPDFSARALRDAGFIPLPRLWVRPSDMEAIHAIAFRHASEVNRIRCAQKHHAHQPGPTAADPATDKEAAWDRFESERSRR